MIKNEDKIKSADQLLNIVFDNNQNEIYDFYENFVLQNEEIRDSNSFWACNFKSLNSCSEIEVIFSNEGKYYNGNITGTECDEYDFCDRDYNRGCRILSISDNKIKIKKTFYKKVKDCFLQIVQLINDAEKEDKKLYDDKCLERFGHYSDELTEEEIDELDNEEYCKWLSDEGWLEED